MNVSLTSYVAEEARPTTADRLIDDIIDRFDLLHFFEYAEHVETPIRVRAQS